MTSGFKSLFIGKPKCETSLQTALTCLLICLWMFIIVYRYSFGYVVSGFMFSGFFHAGFWSDMETQTMEVTQHPNHQLLPKSRNLDGFDIVD